MFRYILIGGYIASKSDGGVHYISAKRLRELYGLPPSECVLIDHWREMHKMNGMTPDKYVILRPRVDGDYREYLASVI